MALTVGAAAVGVSSLSMQKEAEPVDAATYTGSIIIKKDDDTLKSRTKLVGYLFNDQTNAWGEAVTNNANTYQEYSWSVSFQPTTIIILNVENNWASTWDNPWWSPKCRTGNVTLSSSDVIWMKNNASESANWGSYSLESYVKGGSSDNWSTPTVNTKLSNIKTDGSKIEVYGEVNLPANTYFKTVKTGVNPQEWIGNYSCHDSIKSNLSTSASGNIHNTNAATYEFYFNFDGNTTYITDPVQASADEWAQDFLSGGCTSTMTNWSTHATEYGKLSAASKALFTAVASGGNENGTYIEQAVARYDLVEVRYGKTAYTEFMGREAAGKLTPKAANNIIFNYGEGNYSLPLVIVIGAILIAGAATGGYFMIRRRREN